MMKRINVFLATIAVACLMSSAAYGFTHKYVTDKITGIDLSSIEKLFIRAMGNESEGKQPDPKAQYELGVLFFTMYEAAHFDGSDEHDRAKSYALAYNLNQAAYWLREAAWDYAPAQYLLANVYYWYLGDHEAGYMWLDKAVENGYARAQALKADICCSGHDYAKAMELARKSAQQGDAFGMYVMSRVYGDQRYKGYDKAKSKEWEKKAREAAKTDPTFSFDDDDDLPVIREKGKK